MSNSFDEYNGRSHGGYQSRDTRNGSRSNGLRMASPSVGLPRLSEDYQARRSYTPEATSRGNFSLERSFRVSESSPSERRRLVSELRSEVRKAAMKSSSSSPSRSAAPSHGLFLNGGSDYGTKRPFESSLRDERRAPQLDFDERIPAHYGRSTEEEAERELAELARSTENLRRLGSDIMSSASAYVNQSRADPMYAHRATQLPRSSSSPMTQHASYMAAPQQQQPVPMMGHAMPMSPYPGYMMPPGYMPAPYPAAYAMPPPGMMASPPAPGTPGVAMPPMMYPSPPMSTPSGFYYMPGPGGYPTMVYASQPPTFSPIVSQAPQSSAVTAAPVGRDTSAEMAAPAIKPAEERLNRSAPASVEPIRTESNTAVSAEPARVDRSAAQPVESTRTVVQAAPARTDSNPQETVVTFSPSLSSASSASKRDLLTEPVFVPSGQTSAEDVPPAHVDLNALEEERKRRMKKEFLAKKQKEGSKMADMAMEAAQLVNGKKEEEAPAVSRSAAPAATPRPVIIDNTSEDKLVAGELSRATSAPDLSTKRRSNSADLPRTQSEIPPSTVEAPTTDEEAERAIRLQKQAEEAANLPPVDNTMAMVPFGNFLKFAGGSYDDADLAGSVRSLIRPPPIFGKASSRSDLHAGRRRAQSIDDTNLGSKGASIASRTSIIAKPADRQPIAMQGYLFKTSGPKRPTQTRGTWQKRWFILSGTLLLYVSSEESTQVKRMMDLNKVEVITDRLPELDGAPTMHCIGLVEKGEPRMLTVCARSHEEILEWYKGIVQNCALLCKNRIPQKSLPPPNRVKEDPRERWRKDIEARHIAGLPMPPTPEASWFYPHWEKPKSYYDLLGVAPDATPGIIKKAYYRIAKDSHPDRSSRSLKAENLSPDDFAGVALAYETLIDPTKRSEYDLAEKVKEELRCGISCYRLESVWDDDDLQIEPRLRVIRKVVRRRITIFCDGEIKCLYWQPQPEPNEDGTIPLVPLRPGLKRSVEMRFVQQILYFRDGPIDFGKNGPPPYENETRLLVLGDRLHTGPLLFQMESPQACTELVHGLRVARCEKSMLFQQKLDALRAQGIQ